MEGVGAADGISLRGASHPLPTCGAFVCSAERDPGAQGQGVADGP